MPKKKKTDYEMIQELLENERFHVVLDNDMFWIYPEGYDHRIDSMGEREWEEWRESGVKFYHNPEFLLEVMIDFLGGSSEKV